MGRPSHTQITGELAKKIVKKLKGKESKRPGKDHSHAFYDVFSLKGIYITSLSLRHGADSKKYLGHDHMIEQLKINAFKAKQLAQCTMSRRAWIVEVYGDEK
jgi:hypothetical protein